MGLRCLSLSESQMLRCLILCVVLQASTSQDDVDAKSSGDSLLDTLFDDSVLRDSLDAAKSSSGDAILNTLFDDATFRDDLDAAKSPAQIAGAVANELNTLSDELACPAKVMADQHCSGHTSVEIRSKERASDFTAASFCAQVFRPSVFADSQKWFRFDDSQLKERQPELLGGLYVQFPHDFLGVEASVSVSVSGQDNAKVFFFYNNDTAHYDQRGNQMSAGPGYTERCKEEMPSAMKKAGFSGRKQGPWYDTHSTTWSADHGEHVEMWSKELKSESNVRVDLGKVENEGKACTGTDSMLLAGMTAENMMTIVPKMGVKCGICVQSMHELGLGPDALVATCARDGPRSCMQTAGLVVQGPCSLSITVSPQKSGDGI